MGREDVMNVTAYSPHREQRALPDGLTVLELVIVLGLIGLLGSIAFLQVQPLLAQVRLDSSARQIATDLQVMRMRAIAQNCRFRVTFRLVRETMSSLIRKKAPPGFD
jgi:Tfp pilus assembly protein FimT